MSSHNAPDPPRCDGRDQPADPMMPVARAVAALTEPVPPTILDVQWVLGRPGAGAAQYRAAHLPTARFCDLDSVLAGEVRATGGRHPLPDPDRLQQDLRALGVRRDRPVVVYDAGDGYAAARAWWVLTWAGHPAVSVLDGGLRAWQDAGAPVTDEIPSAADSADARGDFQVRPGALPTIDANEVAAFVRSGGLLMDARSPERFRGEHEPVDPEAGHIPGALNLPTAAIVDETGRYLAPADMRVVFDTVRSGGGRTAPSEPVAVYCGSGVTATHVILGLRRLGVEAMLYPGSWSDWITDPDRPRATG